jgi:hypothetical protein
MGTIDYVGHIAVSPTLSEDEIEHLRGLRKSRHRGSSEPDGRSPWLPCDDGCCLTGSGKASSGSAASWLRHLIRHHLSDHDLLGKVVGCSRDDRELFVVSVTRNRVQTRVLWSPTSEQSLAVAVPGPRRTSRDRTNVIYLNTRRPKP